MNPVWAMKIMINEMGVVIEDNDSTVMVEQPDDLIDLVYYITEYTRRLDSNKIGE